MRPLAALTPGKRPGTHCIQGWVMTAEVALDEEHFVRFNVHNKDKVHEMVSIFEEQEPSNTECEVSQVDLDAIADEDLLNAIMNSDSESKTLENKSSDEEIITDKISWSKAADVYCTTL